MVDQLAGEYGSSPVYFLEYPADGAPANRYGRWWAAYGGSSSVYLPLLMTDSGNQISNGSVDFYNVYKTMVDTAAARPAKAAVTAYSLRCGDKLRFYVRVTNHSGTSLSYSSNHATVHAIVWEDAHVADTNRYVRATVSADFTSSVADGANASFVLETPELTGIDWDKLHTAVLADYRPGGLTGAFDTLQAALAPRASPARRDFDGDGMQDIAVRRPESGVWYLLPSSTPGEYGTAQWGLPTDVPVPGDYDGDGRSDVAVWRPSAGVWYVRPSGSPGTYTATAWGTSGDIPVPGDYDGDGRDDRAVWRPSTGVWYVKPSASGGAAVSVRWGMADDIPVSGDYDGDGKTDIAVRRPSTGVWYILGSSAGGAYTAMQWGVASDIPVPGNYDGDARTDVAVWRPSTGVWYVKPSATAGTYTTTAWGTSGDVPVSGDFDGDGKADVAVWRPANGVWYIKPSASPSGPTTRKWGAGTDEAISPLSGILRTLSK